MVDVQNGAVAAAAVEVLVVVVVVAVEGGGGEGGDFTVPDFIFCIWLNYARTELPPETKRTQSWDGGGGGGAGVG